jgi:hypothetical protein
MHNAKRLACMCAYTYTEVMYVEHPQQLCLSDFRCPLVKCMRLTCEHAALLIHDNFTRIYVCYAGVRVHHQQGAANSGPCWRAHHAVQVAAAVGQSVAGLRARACILGSSTCLELVGFGKYSRYWHVIAFEVQVGGGDVGEKGALRRLSIERGPIASYDGLVPLWFSRIWIRGDYHSFLLRQRSYSHLRHHVVHLQ